jgi:D-serine deaminase-like pyridoxal phosphate-dependent protein
MLNIAHPTLLLDEELCRRNILRQVDKAKQERVAFRPHFKTHQSHEIGRWYKELGVTKITVSSLQMAAYFAKDGWKDITVAFPVNILEHAFINDLAKNIQLNILVSDPSVIESLNTLLRQDVGVFIELDTGQQRSGFASDAIGSIAQAIQSINIAKHLRFCGFLTHAGQSYQMQCSTEQLQAIHEESLKKIEQFTHLFKQQQEKPVVSVGDTPTFIVANNFSGIDEVRPGNAVFFDLTQQCIGVCEKADIAVQIACPIVAVYPDREEFIIYGGAIHFSKDRLELPNQTPYYGELATLNNETVQTPYKLTQLSQEHGTVKADKAFCRQLKVGDIASFYPVHSCLSVDTLPHYVTKKGRVITKFQFGL